MGLSRIESYIFGLLITDGNLYFAKERNRGRVTLEVSEKDKDIVEKLHELYPESHISVRTRSTNFSDNYTSYSFVDGMLPFRTRLVDSGYPRTDKTNLASIPSVEYYSIDFWRGVIDGDGSLGFTKAGSPFVSLVTKSENLKTHYLEFLKEEFKIIKREPSRNKRDNVYNLLIINEAAVDLVRLLYLEDSPEIYINRKYNSAVSMQSWVRTSELRAYRSDYKERRKF